MKPLKQVSARDASGLRRALEHALSGGPAIWPVPAAPAPAASTPASAGGFRTSEHEHSRSLVRDPLGGGSGAGEVGDGVALVVETSGSTAAPKRVLLSADALIASADATHDALGGAGHWLLALPGHYIAGAQVLVRSIVAGLEPVVLDSVTGDVGFDAAAFAEASTRLMPEVPHYTALVPVQLGRIVEAAERDAFIAAALRSFDAILVGGQALGADIARRADELGARIVRTYGSSETAGGCVYDGVPLEGVRVREVGGEVQLGGPTLADGYLDDPERTARSFVVDRGERWYRTGDLGEVVDGRLRIRGRADDVIISGGVKVALGEVERAVRALPGHGEAVVVAVDDAEWGQRPAVVLELALAGQADPDDVAIADRLAVLGQATDASGLPPAARPTRLVVLDELPRLDSGKPDRRALAALLAGGAGGVGAAGEASDEGDRGGAGGAGEASAGDARVAPDRG